MIMSKRHGKRGSQTNPAESVGVSNLSSGMDKVRTEPGGAIIERDTPVHLLITRRDIGVARVTTTRPPAARLGIRRGIGAASAGTVSRGNVGDVEAVELLQPLLDLVGVRRRDLILRGPVALLENDWAHCEYGD